VSSQSIVDHVRTLDGLRLAATLVTPEGRPEHAVVMVHGGGVSRDEGGFFTRLAAGLAAAGVASLRFDLRGHGESEGLNDIRVALTCVGEATGALSLSLLGASFAGGVCAYYAAKRPAEIDRLVLLNPQLDYKQRTIDSRGCWHDDQLDEEMAEQVRQQGYIQFTPTLRHGRPILNEVFWFEPLTVLGDIVRCPVGANPADATNFLGGIADVLEEKSHRGLLDHLEALAKVWLYMNDRQIKQVSYREVAAAEVSYTVLVRSI
jgi:pimeloyl-ACP methyl ester carboxylesterase